MRKIIAITQITLDGVMQSPGGPEEDPRHGFTHGGWAMPFFDASARRIIDTIITGRFEMLLGRRTYDIFAAHWPHHGDDPIGKAFNRARKHVVTRRRDPLSWKNSRTIGGDFVGKLRRLKATKGPAFHVWGSGKLLQALMAADLVDEHRLWVFPVVLGMGERLFQNGVPLQRFSLVETRSTRRGVLFNTYRRTDRVRA